jgi:hypothetical protein
VTRGRRGGGGPGSAGEARATDTSDAGRGRAGRRIRTGGAFDGVVDFDRATHDPSDPPTVRPAFDSGDHLHPNDRGLEAMANAIDLALLDRHAV